MATYAGGRCGGGAAHLLLAGRGMCTASGLVCIQVRLVVSFAYKSVYKPLLALLALLALLEVLCFARAPCLAGRGGCLCRVFFSISLRLFFTFVCVFCIFFRSRLLCFFFCWFLLHMSRSLSLALLALQGEVVVCVVCLCVAWLCAVLKSGHTSSCNRACNSCNRGKSGRL